MYYIKARTVLPISKLRLLSLKLGPYRELIGPWAGAPGPCPPSVRPYLKLLEILNRKAGQIENIIWVIVIKIRNIKYNGMPKSVRSDFGRRQKPKDCWFGSQTFRFQSFGTGIFCS